MQPINLSSSLVIQPSKVGPQSERSFHGAASSVSSPDDQGSRLYHLQGASLFQTSQSAHIEIQNKLFFFCPDTFQTPTTDDSLTLDKIIETLRPKILEKIVLLIHHLEADFIGKKNCTTVVSNIQDRIFGTGRCTKETLDGLLKDVLARKFNKKGLHYPTTFIRDRCLVFTFSVFQYDVKQKQSAIFLMNMLNISLINKKLMLIFLKCVFLTQLKCILRRS